ncbi:hypothetical protein DFH06DRAFT_936867, partial [Mycena polygramma]
TAVDKAAETWAEILPSMVSPLLIFRASEKRDPSLPAVMIGACKQQSGCCPTSWTLRCLFAHLLLKHGLFPCTPTKPQAAVCVHLLDLWKTIQANCTASVTGLASTLAAHYMDEASFRSLSLYSESAVKDPFRHQITGAMQWYDNLQSLIEEDVERVLLGLSRPAQSTFTETQHGPLTPGHADYELVQRCPSCFNLEEWGRRLSNSEGDIHVGIDGNSTHKHNADGGDGPTGHNPRFFLPRAEVDGEGERIALLRLGPKTIYEPDIPDDVVDQCARSYTAANEKLGKAVSAKFDETGIFHLSCRHNIPLYVVSMNTPGEEHKYFVTLIKHIISRLPPQATICLFSDVACIIDRALKSRALLPESVMRRLHLSLNVLHCLNHAESCQMVLSPRRQVGMGLTDGEFVERVLSMLRNRITVTRSQWAARRIWTLEQQLDFIAQKERNGSGNWLRKRRIHLRQEIERATQSLRKYGIPLHRLREEFKLEQQAAKISDTRSDSDDNGELEKLLKLQLAFDQLEGQVARTLRKTHAKDISRELTTSLTHLKSRIDDVYAVDIAKRVPTLHDTSLAFMKKLVMARDLKRTIQRLAVASFSKWEEVDQAKGGRGSSIGTTANTSLHKSITKEAEPLMAAIHKYNALCREMEQMPRDNLNVPCPCPLPIKLADLRADPDLFRNVWVGIGAQPNHDPDHRKAIDAMLIVDRCIEEHVRLLREGVNLVRWVDTRLSAIDTAL